MEDNRNVTLLTPDLFAIWGLEGLEVFREEKDLIKQIRRGTETESHEEVIVKAIKELKKSPVKSMKSSEWSMEDGLLRYRGTIYVQNTDLCWKITALCHDSKISRHPRRWKMLELISQNYWWPQMSRYVGQYVSTCDMCLCTKTIKKPPTGQLHPLPILDTSWDTVSVDFITELPESNRKDSIMVVVNSHHSFRSWDSSTLCPTHMETSWTT